MTHDELLTKINSFTCCSGAHEIALRAVVELHKPSKIPNWVPTNHKFICDGCTRIYPCPTIQAVIKELR
jgi:hypothetical protein